MMERNKNLFLKTMDKEVKLLLDRFQQQVIMPYIHQHGNLKGYRRAIYLLLPKYDKRLKLYRKIEKATYDKLYNYLIFQSQRYLRQQRNNANVVQHIRDFQEADHRYLCYEREWYNGVTAHGDPVHSACQLVALREGATKYGFKYHENNYGLLSEQFAHIIRWVRIDLMDYYRKILAQKFSNHLSEKPNKIN